MSRVLAAAVGFHEDPREGVSQFPTIWVGQCPNCCEQIYYYRDNTDHFIGRDQLVALEERLALQMEAQKGR